MAARCLKGQRLLGLDMPAIALERVSAVYLGFWSVQHFQRFSSRHVDRNHSQFRVSR